MIYLNHNTDNQDIYIPRQKSINVTETGIDLSNYLTSAQTIELVDEEVQSAITTALDGYATEEWVENKGYITEQSLSGYSTTEEVEEMISGATSGFVTSGEVATQINDSISGIPTEFKTVNNQSIIGEGNIQIDGAIYSAGTNIDIDNDNVISVTGISIPTSNTAFTNDAGYITSADTADFVTSGDVKSQIESYDYATESQIPDVSDFVTSADVKSQIESYDYLTSADTANYVTSGDVKTQIEGYGYATTGWVENQGYLTEHQSLSGLVAEAEYISSAKTIYFYDKSGVTISTIDATDFIKDGMVDNVYITGNTLVISFNTESGKEDIELDLTDIFNPSNYYTKTEIDGLFDAETARTESTYLKEHQSLSAYSTTQEVEQMIASAKTEVENEIPDVSNFVTSGDVKTQIEGYNYITSGDVPTSNTAFTNDAGYITTADTQDFVTSGEVATQIESYNYITSAAVPTSNTAFTNDAGYITTANTQDFVTSADVKSQIEDYHYITTADTADFVTSGDVQTQINDSISGIPTEFKTINNQSIIGTGNIEIQGGSGSTYTAGNNIDITNDVISVTGISVPTSNTAFTNDAGYITTADTQNFVTSGEVETQITAITSTKQDILVSGENIKTINNISILGEGNITIQGGSGGTGEQVVELTKAEYQALTGYSENTTYVITDADTVDLNDFALQSAVTSAITDINTSLETKATKASVSANGNRVFPKWNADGIITGSTGNTVYEQSLNINGTSKTMLQTTNSSFGTIYAPTSAGTKDTILLSNGSGAPVWSGFKFKFISQSEYDALATKDSTTIYFIVSDL